jgi:hypothetical protein
MLVAMWHREGLHFFCLSPWLFAKSRTPYCNPQPTSNFYDSLSVIAALRHLTIARRHSSDSLPQYSQHREESPDNSEKNPMNFLPLRRRDSALAQLKVPEADFAPLEDEPEILPAEEPEPETEVSPANELVTLLVELDIIEAVREDNPAPVGPPDAAPLSHRHLDTVDRLVAHLRGDEARLEQQIAEARRRLADTRWVRHGYERTGAELRRGIALLTGVRRPAPRRRTNLAVSENLPQHEAANGSGETLGGVNVDIPSRKIH